MNTCFTSDSIIQPNIYQRFEIKRRLSEFAQRIALERKSFKDVTLIVSDSQQILPYSQYLLHLIQYGFITDLCISYEASIQNLEFAKKGRLVFSDGIWKPNESLLLNLHDDLFRHSKDDPGQMIFELMNSSRSDYPYRDKTLFYATHNNGLPIRYYNQVHQNPYIDYDQLTAPRTIELSQINNLKLAIATELPDTSEVSNMISISDMTELPQLFSEIITAFLRCSNYD